MNELILTLERLMTESKPLQIIGIVVYLAAGFAFIKSDIGRRTLRNFRFIFYSEPGLDTSTVTRRRLIELEHQFNSLKKSLSDKDIEGRRLAIQAELDAHLTESLPALVHQKVQELKSVDAAIDESINASINLAVSAYLEKYSVPDIVKSQREKLNERQRLERANILENTIEEQMRSAGRLKMVMINLFVMFNIGVLLVYLFAASNLSDRAITAIIGLYVSLAAFIVYIYRSSNFRTSVLLALREDAKKYFDAQEYLQRLKAGSSPSERDVDVVKLLLLNRAEREKQADHPYELILKGVSNSNIQLKGGKISSSARGTKE